MHGFLWADIRYLSGVLDHIHPRHSPNFGGHITGHSAISRPLLGVGRRVMQKKSTLYAIFIISNA